MTKKFGAPKGSRWFYKSDDMGGWIEKRVDPTDPLPDANWLPGHKPKSEETRRKQSESNMGRIMSPEWRARMSAASKGKPKSEAHKKAMAAALKEFYELRKAGKI